MKYSRCARAGRLAAVGLALAAVPTVALAQDEDGEPRGGPPLHLSVGAGGAALLSGAGGETWRGLAEIDLYPGGRFGHVGGTVAVRSLLLDPFGDAGLITAGVTLEAAAARPLLVLALHGEAGVTFGGDARPALGGGLKTHLGVIGPLAIATDVALHVIANDVDDLTVVVSAGAIIAIVK